MKWWSCHMHFVSSNLPYDGGECCLWVVTLQIFGLTDSRALIMHACIMPVSVHDGTFMYHASTRSMGWWCFDSPAYLGPEDHELPLGDHTVVGWVEVWEDGGKVLVCEELATVHRRVLLKGAEWYLAGVLLGSKQPGKGPAISTADSAYNLLLIICVLVQSWHCTACSWTCSKLGF